MGEYLQTIQAAGREPDLELLLPVMDQLMALQADSSAEETERP